ncbi:MAG TPA: hypothetical protein VF483_09285 [Gemmatimonadaceae bacterium]
MTPASTRRAALLALALTATACDLVKLASDPKPRFQETWNLPGPDTRMSVANLLPAGGTVTILPDSSAFTLKIDSTTISVNLGPNCPACVVLNGTSAPKPAFTLAPSSSTSLPTDIVSAAITAGQIDIALKNGLTFDPLYVNTGVGATTQGYMVIVVRSGSVVLGRDSVRGAAVASGTQNSPFAPGTTLNRSIILTTGTVTGNLTVDVTVNSPLGDHPVPIDVSKSFSATAKVPNINVANVVMNIPSRTFDSGGKDSVSLATKGDFVVGMGLDMTITNPFPTVGGALSMVFAWGTGPTQNITKSVTLPSGCVTVTCVGTSTVVLDSTETQKLLQGGDKVSIKLTGNVTSASPVSVTPKQEVAVSNRIRITVRTPSGE